MREKSGNYSSPTFLTSSVRLPRLPPPPGVVHSHYSYHNISKPAQLALKKLIDLGATLSETFMFAYLGLQVFSLKHVIDWGLIWSGEGGGKGVKDFSCINTLALASV